MLKHVYITVDFHDFRKVDSLNREAFPDEEAVQTEILIKNAESGQCDFIAFYDDSLFVGFIFVVKARGFACLFYFAIENDLRSKGYGSRILHAFRELYAEYFRIVDIEVLDSSAGNYAQRLRRKEFYLRNGFAETDKYYTYNGCHLEILSMDTHFDEKILLRVIGSIRYPRNISETFIAE